MDLAKIEAMLSLQTIEEMQVLLGTLVGDLGFEHFACGVMSFDSVTHVPSIRLLSCYPAEWQSHYNENKYFEQDPVIIHTLHHRRPVPVVWPRPGASKDALHDRIFSEAADFGLRAGMTVSAQSATQIGVLSISSDRPLEHINREIPRALGFAQLLTCYLQEVWNRLAGQLAPYNAIKLSPREIECLHWAAIGKTSWEISCILKISERTVVFHIGRAVEKLDVSNRRQAIARAIVLGLIRP